MKLIQIGQSIILDKVRFQILTDRCIRIEYSETQQFEDHKSQAFWYRDLGFKAFEVIENEKILEIHTEFLQLNYQKGKALSRNSLQITFKKGTFKKWFFGEENTWKNLRGTSRTLDNANDWVELEYGLMSRDGWATVDDSRSLIFNESQWLVNRPNKQVDLYFFGYGIDFKGCLKDFMKLSGKVPMLPKFVLGNWWSRYWEYSDESLQCLMEEFIERDIPLSVCIIDMDWHLVENPLTTGWTGYTWNKSLFKDPEGFINWLHSKGLRTALNLHPAEGVAPHEAAYAQVAKALNVDPTSNEVIPFDCTDPEYMKAYFELLHHPLEAEGVDFWWLDWQQGSTSKVDGMDPLWWLNHQHFMDLGRAGKKRSFIFSRWGGLGNHRYPIGFSGDTLVTWEALKLQPYFTATAANVGYGWWSHDIGGHMGGIEQGELYLRWVQWGVFSPIFRLHSSKNIFSDRRPWGFDDTIYKYAKEVMQLRHQLIPYLYSMAYRNHTEDLPLILPMYYDHGQDPKSYEVNNQYYFGSELIVAPYVTESNPRTGLSEGLIWLPEGDYFEYSTGRYYEGNKEYRLFGRLQDIPVYAKAGSIIPKSKYTGFTNDYSDLEMTIQCFAGASNTFKLYEDDNESENYREGEFALTTIHQIWSDDCLTIKIQTATEKWCLFNERGYTLELWGIKYPEQLTITINNVSIPFEINYNEVKGCVTIEKINVSPEDQIEITILKPQMHKKDCRKDMLFELLKVLKMNMWAKHEVYDRFDKGLLTTNDWFRAKSSLTIEQIVVLEEIINNRYAH